MVKSWPYIATLTTGLIIGWLWNGALWGERYAELERDHAQHLAAQQAASADVISRTLLRERELQEQFEEHEQNAQAEKQGLERDLADSNAVARRMQQQLDDISGRISADTGTAAECEAARAASGVLAELLGEADELAGIFAAEAEGSRIAGSVCEAAYGAARGSDLPGRAEKGGDSSPHSDAQIDE